MRGGGGDPKDTVVADFSTLRLPLALASRLKATTTKERAATTVTTATTSSSSSPPASSPPPLSEALDSLAREHGMRQLSDEDAAFVCPFTHEAIPRAVSSALVAAARRGGSGEAAADENAAADEEVDLVSTFVPIWRLLPWPLFAFEGSRAGARALASALSDREGEVGRIARAAVEEAARMREAKGGKGKEVE